jgi:hypothetical protein
VIIGFIEKATYNGLLEQESGGSSNDHQLRTRSLRLILGIPISCLLWAAILYAAHPARLTPNHQAASLAIVP